MADRFAVLAFLRSLHHPLHYFLFKGEEPPVYIACDERLTIELFFFLLKQERAQSLRVLFEEMSMEKFLTIIIIHSFYIALFSALEQTHCTYVACDSERVTVSFYSAY